MKGDIIGDSIATKTVKGSFFSLGSSAITIVSGFARSVILARLLTPRDFGIVALALFFLSITNQFRDFGFNWALVHRDTDVSVATSTHFVLRVGMTFVMMLLTLAAAPVLNHLYPLQPRMISALLVLSLIEFLNAVNSTPNFTLRKKMEFKYLAILDVVSSLAMTIFAPAMALAGLGFWSLVGEQAIAALVRTIGLWGIRRPWRLSLKFDKGIARWYFRFGYFVFLSSSLTFLLDQFDDFWTGTVLGAVPLGFYSRAYEFARYPRRAIANPITRVFFPAYAKLQHDRLRLSKAFYRASSLMIRVGFLLSLVFVLVAPEFTHIFIGAKWLPMVPVFRFMILYTLLDPLILTSGHLLTAIGRPQILTKIKGVQLLVFIPAVIILSYSFGVEGVAIAVDLMAIIGLALVFTQIRQFVDFSLRKMFCYPFVSLLLSVGITLFVEGNVSLASDWLSFILKGGLAAAIYSILMLLFEFPQCIRGLRLVYHSFLQPR
ncbi:MAG: lipopolysaccharide biosynthesis protein [Anaerolineae bacterium]